MQESSRIEYKQTLTDNFEKEVVAFLNYHEGGVIYIGISNDGKVIGCEKADEIQLKIKDKLKHNISPSCLGLFEVILETIDDKTVVKVVIASGREIPYYIKKHGMSSKGCFIRVGSSEPISEMMIEDLFAKRDRNPLSKIKSHRQDLTFEQLKIYYEEKSLKLNDKFASNLELLTEDGHFNYVAYLLADTNGVSIKVALREVVINAMVHNDYTTELLSFIKTNLNLKAKQLSVELNISLRTLQRYIKQLTDENKIEFKDAPKTGGYHVK